MEQKKTFRKRQTKIMREFASSEQKKQEDQSLYEQVIKSPLLIKSQTIGITSSLELEVDTSKLIAYLWHIGKEIYLAKAYDDPEHIQDFLFYDYTSRLTKSSFGVSEINEPHAKINNHLDLLIVPGLAFAQDSHQRLGFGGGNYDRFLAKYPGTKTLSLVNSKMLYQTAAWPIETTDVPIDTLITSN